MKYKLVLFYLNKMLPVVTGPDDDGYIYEIFSRIKYGKRERVTRKYRPKKNNPNTEAFLFKLRRKHRLLTPFGLASKNNDGCTLRGTEVGFTDPNVEEKDDTVSILKMNMAKIKIRRLEKIPTAKYKPPSSEHTTQLRVSNLTRDAVELDLRELFGHYGRITRVFIAKDHTTGESRGFAFVTFCSRQEAATALQNLNGHGYGYLILRVEWAKPRKIKEKTYYSGYGKALPQTEKK